MENTTQNTVTIKKQAVYSKDQKHRYELTLSLPEQKGKSIFVLCLNPASTDLLVTDTTTNYLMNNLFPSGYTTITLCNLFSIICGKLAIHPLFSGQRFSHHWKFRKYRMEKNENEKEDTEDVH